MKSKCSWQVFVESVCRWIIKHSEMHFLYLRFRKSPSCRLLGPGNSSSVYAIFSHFSLGFRCWPMSEVRQGYCVLWFHTVQRLWLYQAVEMYCCSNCFPSKQTKQKFNCKTGTQRGKLMSLQERSFVSVWRNMYEAVRFVFTLEAEMC